MNQEFQNTKKNHMSESAYLSALVTKYPTIKLQHLSFSLVSVGS